MGARIEEAKSEIKQGAAQEQTQQAEAARQRQEDLLQQEEQQLGTSAQIAGKLPGAVSAAEQPYIGRYSLDRGALDRLPTVKVGQVQKGVDSANALLDQAQQAAAAGNTTLAESLRSQAEGALLANFKPYLSGIQGSVRQFISLVQPTGATAASQLNSPLAQTVGQTVARARGLSDPNSPESQQVQQMVREQPAAVIDQGVVSGTQAIELGKENALRAQAADQRGVARQFRDAGLSRSFATQPGMQAALTARAGEQFATQRATTETGAAQQEAQLRADTATQKAQILQQGGQWLENFRSSFVQNATGMAQAFLQNQAGIREQFQGAMDQLALSGAQFQMQAAQMSQQLSLAYMQQDQMNQEFRLQRQAMLEQFGVSLVSQGLGSATGGVLGTQPGSAPAVGGRVGSGIPLGAPSYPGAPLRIPGSPGY